jgi:hypothetical protein
LPSLSPAPEIIVTIALAASTVAHAADHPAPPRKDPVPNARISTTLSSVSAMSASDAAQCVADLMSRKVVFEQTSAVQQEGCELMGAIRLSAVTTSFGDVTLSGKPAMLCSFALEFSGWVREVAAPLTLAYTGKTLTAIDTGSAFACRARYDKPGQIPSEHAKGDAIDVVSFLLADNRRIRVKEDASDLPMARDFIHALRMTACGYFTTVLGPGADGAHADHLHLDSMVHGATANYRICE